MANTYDKIYVHSLLNRNIPMTIYVATAVTILPQDKKCFTLCINSFVKRFDVDDSIITLYNRYYMNYRGVELSDNGKVNYKNNKIYKGLNFRVYSSQFFVIESTDGYEIKYIS